MAKGLTGGGGAEVQVAPPIAAAVEVPVDNQSPVVEPQGQETERKSIALGKSGLSMSKTTGGGLSI
ncbi:hypothetical protein [Escherichia coli]|uniref:hypothetical protein n=1 Tax=Escherichia coli TaxID=562 RepID=UPI002917067B|nr:hypothetical protein [Escherichia coli]